MKTVLLLVLYFSAAIASESILHNQDHVHNKEHLKEHMKETFHTEESDTLKLEDNEAVEFHYFKLHDHDNNNKLDGLELAAALTHYHEEDASNKNTQSVQLDDGELSMVLDQILKDDDLNGDGYIDYYEFTQSQRKNRVST